MPRRLPILGHSVGSHVNGVTVAFPPARRAIVAILSGELQDPDTMELLVPGTVLLLEDDEALSLLAKTPTAEVFWAELAADNTLDL